MNSQIVYNHNGDERIVKKIKLNMFSVELEEIEKGVYTYRFQKSLSNIKTESELLPLTVKVLGLSPCFYTIEGDNVVLQCEIISNSVGFSTFSNKKDYEKLQVLRNVRCIYTSFQKGYTHVLHPNNIYVDDNCIPYVLYRGYQDVLEPVSQTEEDFIRQYKSLAFSLLDSKYDFETLYNGALEYTKKTAFLEKIYEAKTVEEIEQYIFKAYCAEKEVYENNHIDVIKSRYRFLRIFGILGITLSVIFTCVMGWVFLIKVPYDEKLVRASGYYAAEQYSEVITTLAHDEVSNLPKSHRYMLAKSYLEQESMRTENKVEARKVLTYESDQRILAFWITLGRDDYKTAINIAKDLESPAYTYIATFKAVEIISKMRGDGEQKEKNLEMYKKELLKCEEQMKKNNNRLLVSKELMNDNSMQELTQ